MKTILPFKPIIKMRQYFILFTVAMLAIMSCTPKASISVLHQTCEYIENPLGIDVSHPRFSWTLNATKRKQVQTAYEIIVSDNLNDIKANKGNIWSSGKVNSNQNTHVSYQGTPLQSFMRYYWKIRVYDSQGYHSSWSKSSWFEMAMMNESDWKAHWISDGSVPFVNDADFYNDDPAPLFRQTFTIPKKIASARLYITGLGYYEPYLNGEKIGDQMLDPGWTTYSKLVLYATYDVTKLLKKGENTLGVMAGNGWYNPLPFNMWCSPSRNLRQYLDCGRPTVKAQLRITYTDGAVDEIYTDQNWQVAPGPIIKNNIYLGEVYDARAEQPGWTVPGTELQNSKKAIVTEGPRGKLSAQMIPQIKPIEIIKPISIIEIEPDVYLCDMGVNFAGVVRLNVTGPEGTNISLRYGEDIYPDGKLNGMTSVAGQMKGCFAGEGSPHIAWQEDHYILKGDPKGEIWNPRFTFHGFRYVEIKGWPGTPELKDIEGLRLSSGVEDSGYFNCSNDMFNTLQDNIQRTFRSNMFSVQSDCPAREKFAYGGDILCTAEAFLFNYNMAHFYGKTVEDHRLAQRPLGGITETAPYVGIEDHGPGDGSGPLGFQLGFTFIIDKLYEFYGDIRVIEDNYEALKKQADFLINSADNHLFNSGLSDHESLDEKPFGLTESLFYLDHIHLMAKYAKIMEKKEDAEKYLELEDRIKEQVVNTYYNLETGVFANGSQTAQVFGLSHDLLSDKDKLNAFSVLRQSFDARDNHLSTGIFGTKLMLDLLREHDMNEHMYRIANQRDFPGWGYMIEKGATSLWETWAYSDNIYSQNHPMFGSISEWFYRSLLGINPQEPGFEKFIIKPQPAGDLSFANGSYNSIQGKIGVEWKIVEDNFFLSVEVPVNTSAIIHIPSSSGIVTESGKEIDIDVISYHEYRNGYVTLSIGSGKYQFETSYKEI